MDVLRVKGKLSWAILGRARVLREVFFNSEAKLEQQSQWIVSTFSEYRYVETHMVNQQTSEMRQSRRRVCRESEALTG